MFCKVCGNWMKDSETTCSVCGTEKHAIESSDEFKWNLKDFPKPKDRGNIKVDWNSGTIEDLETGQVYSQQVNKWISHEDPPIKEDRKDGREPKGELFDYSRNSEKIQNILDKEFDKVTSDKDGAASVHTSGFDNLDLYDHADDFSDLLEIDDDGGGNGEGSNVPTKKLSQVSEELEKQKVQESKKSPEPAEKPEDESEYRKVTMYPKSDGRYAMEIMSKEEEERIAAEKEAQHLARQEEIRKAREEIQKSAESRKQRSEEEKRIIHDVAQEHEKTVEEKNREAQKKFDELLNKEKEYKQELSRLGKADFLGADEAAQKKEAEKAKMNVDEDDADLEQRIEEFKRRSEMSARKNYETPESVFSLDDYESNPDYDLKKTGDIKFETMDIQGYASSDQDKHDDILDIMNRVGQDDERKAEERKADERKADERKADEGKAEEKDISQKPEIKIERNTRLKPFDVTQDVEEKGKSSPSKGYNDSDAKKRAVLDSYINETTEADDNIKTKIIPEKDSEGTTSSSGISDNTAGNIVTVAALAQAAEEAANIESAFGALRQQELEEKKKKMQEASGISDDEIDSAEAQAQPEEDEEEIDLISDFNDLNDIGISDHSSDKKANESEENAGEIASGADEGNIETEKSDDYAKRKLGFSNTADFETVDTGTSKLDETISQDSGLDQDSAFSQDGEFGHESAFSQDGEFGHESVFDKNGELIQGDVTGFEEIDKKIKKHDSKDVEIKIEEPTGTKVTVKTQEVKLIPTQEMNRIKTREVSLEELRQGPKNLQVSVEVTSKKGQSSVEVVRMHDGLTRVRTTEEGETKSEHIYEPGSPTGLVFEQLDDNLVLKNIFDEDEDHSDGDDTSDSVKLGLTEDADLIPEYNEESGSLDTADFGSKGFLDIDDKDDSEISGIDGVSNIGNISDIDNTGDINDLSDEDLQLGLGEDAGSTETDRGLVYHGEEKLFPPHDDDEMMEYNGDGLEEESLDKGERQDTYSNFNTTGPLGIVFEKVENNGMGLPEEETQSDIQTIFFNSKLEEENESEKEAEKTDGVSLNKDIDTETSEVGEDDEKSEKSHSTFGIVSKILIALLLIILIGELSVVGIKMFAPDSMAAQKIESIERIVLGQINNTISGS